MIYPINFIKIMYNFNNNSNKLIKDILLKRLLYIIKILFFLINFNKIC